MHRKLWLWLGFLVLIVAFALLQFVPSPEPVAPVRSSAAPDPG